MRIISGSHKGRRLTAPKGLPVRPTTDFAKEGLFNMLHHRFALHDVGVLDLYAGTGNIAYEFGSRGAQSITCVDQHAACCHFIDQTAAQLDLPITAVRSEVTKFLERHSGQYDIVFADPPYDFPKKNLFLLIDRICDGSFLNQDGLLIIEHTKDHDLTDHPNFNEARRYGGSVFSYFSN
ncbi:MAG: RsmD family RNA methyltransferase [Flavobacteriaceae bacterium]|nr:RsmD family RNA methyltransferase [Flavobacteriaceae bacterium]